MSGTGPVCAIMHNFTPIGVIAAEISVPDVYNKTHTGVAFVVKTANLVRVKSDLG